MADMLTSLGQPTIRLNMLPMEHVKGRKFTEKTGEKEEEEKEKE